MTTTGKRRRSDLEEMLGDSVRRWLYRCRSCKHETYSSNRLDGHRECFRYYNGQRCSGKIAEVDLR